MSFKKFEKIRLWNFTTRISQDKTVRRDGGFIACFERMGNVHESARLTDYLVPAPDCNPHFIPIPTSIPKDLNTLEIAVLLRNGKEMAKKGRPIGKRVRDYNGEFLSESDQLIITALRKAPRTFTKLQETTGLSTSTLSDHLRRLEKLGYIERSSGDSRIIQLTPKASSPRWKTLQNLATVCPTIHLDVDTGEKSLTTDVISAILNFATLDYRLGKWLSWEERKKCHREFLVEVYGRYEKIPEAVREIAEESDELTGNILLTALARYDFEQNWVSDALEDAPHYYFLIHLYELDYEEFKEFYRREKDNPNLFPIRTAAKKMGISKELDELLEWIRPLLEGEKQKLGPKRIQPVAGNLAAQVFYHELTDYRKTITELWRKHRAPPSRGEKEKAKGGEK